jgi:probable rRNA maturation factor
MATSLPSSPGSRDVKKTASAKKHELDLQIEDARWLKIKGLDRRLKMVAAVTLASLPAALRFPAQLTLLLTSDAAMKRLNRDFRGKPKPTNVLSFPQFEPAELTKIGKTGAAAYVGDIALGYQYVVGEANKTHKILINHVTHLLIHGILHLFGYDHLTEADAVRMERLEKKILAGLNLPDPYLPQTREPKAR